MDFHLRRRSIQSEQCDDGQKAVDRVMEAGVEHFQVIFLDNVMPVMSGLEAASRLRGMGYKNLIIGITGNALETDRREFEEAGADIVLVKPFKLEYLDNLLKYMDRYGYRSFPFAHGNSSEVRYISY